MEHRREHLTGRIELDGNQFHDCVFWRASMVYAGGQLPFLEGNNIIHSTFVFEGEAANTIRFLVAMRGIGFEQLVDATLENIKLGRVTETPAGDPTPSGKDEIGRQFSTVVESGKLTMTSLADPEKLKQAEIAIRALDVGTPDLLKLQWAIELIASCANAKPRTVFDTSEQAVVYADGGNRRVTIRDGMYWDYDYHMGEEASVFHE